MIKNVFGTKKGSVADLFIFMIMSLVIITISVTLLFGFRQADTKIIENIPQIQNAVGNSSNVTYLVNEHITKTVTGMDSLKWTSTLLIFGYILGILIFSYFSRSHPVLIVVWILVWIMALILSAPLSNSYVTISETPQLASVWAEFIVPNFIMKNLPYWIAILGFLSTVFQIINYQKGRDNNVGI